MPCCFNASLNNNKSPSILLILMLHQRQHIAFLVKLKKSDVVMLLLFSLASHFHTRPQAEPCCRFCCVEACYCQGHEHSLRHSVPPHHQTNSRWLTLYRQGCPVLSRGGENKHFSVLSHSAAPHETSICLFLVFIMLFVSFRLVLYTYLDVGIKRGAWFLCIFKHGGEFSRKGHHSYFIIPTTPPLFCLPSLSLLSLPPASLFLPPPQWSFISAVRKSAAPDCTTAPLNFLQDMRLFFFLLPFDVTLFWIHSLLNYLIALRLFFLTFVWLFIRLFICLSSNI